MEATDRWTPWKVSRKKRRDAEGGAGAGSGKKSIVFNQFQWIGACVQPTSGVRRFGTGQSTASGKTRRSRSHGEAGLGEKENFLFDTMKLAGACVQTTNGNSRFSAGQQGLWRRTLSSSSKQVKTTRTSRPTSWKDEVLGYFSTLGVFYVCG
jgi:hypothetical protein